jgi:hypothetical protein
MASISRAVCLLLVSLALFQSAVHGLTASDPEPKPVERIQAAFKEVTELSNNLRVETQKITFINAGSQGVKIAAGFSTIIVKVTEYTARLAGSAYGYTPSPLPDADAKLVVQSLTTFVKVHQALLNVVIGKHGIATLFPFFEPIRVSLVNLEEVIDAFAFYLIDLIPTQKPAANDQFGALSVTLKDAQTTYSNSLQQTARLPKTDKPLVDTINEAIKAVTELSDNLRKETAKINNFNAPKQGYKIAEGFSVIIKTVIEASAALAPGTSANPSPLDDDAAKTVVKTLTTFVQVHQALLNTVIGKHGLLTLIPFFEPIRLALVQLELVVDTFAFNLINLIPTQQPAASLQVASLDVTIRDAVNTYSSPVSKTALTVHAIEGLIDH